MVPVSGMHSRIEWLVTPSVMTPQTLPMITTTGTSQVSVFYRFQCLLYVADLASDIARIAALGTKAYSFSISWSRVFPFGRGEINEQALAHYDDVINTCLEYGVEPIVTL